MAKVVISTTAQVGTSFVWADIPEAPEEMLPAGGFSALVPSASASVIAEILAQGISATFGIPVVLS